MGRRLDSSTYRPFRFQHDGPIERSARPPASTRGSGSFRHRRHHRPVAGERRGPWASKASRNACSRATASRCSGLELGHRAVDCFREAEQLLVIRDHTVGVEALGAQTPQAELRAEADPDPGLGAGKREPDTIAPGGVARASMATGTTGLADAGHRSSSVEARPHSPCV